MELCQLPISGIRRDEYSRIYDVFFLLLGSSKLILRLHCREKNTCENGEKNLTPFPPIWRRIKIKKVCHWVDDFFRFFSLSGHTEALRFYTRQKLGTKVFLYVMLETQA